MSGNASTVFPSPPDRQSDGGHREDLAYTTNHAIACTLTDAAEPYLDNWFQRRLGVKFPMGCGHHHGAHEHHGHDHDHDHHHHHGKDDNLWRWYAGEFVGDFGAVPITLAAQTYTPQLMQGMQSALEPVLGGAFRLGAKLSAKSWAARQGFTPDSPECKAKEAEIYAHEVGHLPQAALWTASSIGLNLATQRILGNKGALWQLAAAKAMGASLNTVAVVGARAALPQTARTWDQFTTEHIFEPTAEFTRKLFGGGREEDTGWTARIAQPDAKPGGRAA